MGWPLSAEHSVTLCLVVLHRVPDINTNIRLLCDPGSIPFHWKTSINTTSLGAEFPLCYVNSLSHPLIESLLSENTFSLVVVILMCFKMKSDWFSWRNGKLWHFSHTNCSLLCFTGGHTTEILRLLSCLSESYSPRHYVLADSDKMSEAKIRSFEQKRAETFSESQVIC